MKNVSKLIICSVVIFSTIPCFAQMQETLMLTIFPNNNANNSDQTAIRFMEEATDAFDSQLDAYKIQNRGNTPNIYTVSDQNYAVNTLNNHFETKTTEIHFKGDLNGVYTINAEEIGSFDSNWSITLLDKKTTQTRDLRAEPIYSFDNTTGDEINRFSIEFHIDQTVTSDLNANSKSKEEFAIYAYEANITVETNGASCLISVTDLNGKELIHNHSENNRDWVFAPGKTGLYLVNVLKGNKRFYKKVYVGS